MRKKTHMIAADFFAGIGLVELGLKRQGWSIAYAVDYSEEKKRMYDGHFKNGHYHVKDVADVSGKEIPDIALAHASFPCTDTSIAGSREGLNGKESSSIWSFLRIIEEMKERRPPLILLENVQGFITSNRGEDLESTLLTLNKLGYAVDLLLLDASHFVPQSRVRLFVLGILNHGETDSSSFENHYYRDHITRPRQIVQFIESHSHIKWKLRNLPPLPVLENKLDAVIDDLEEWWEQDRVDYLISQMYERHKSILVDHKDRNHHFYGTVFRRMRVRDGRKQSTAELRSDGIAGCLRTPKGGSAKQILVRSGKGEIKARLLNGRECARLMGAGDYLFDENLSLNQILYGLGDAVCVPVIEWLAGNYLNPSLESISEAVDIRNSI